MRNFTLFIFSAVFFPVILLGQSLDLQWEQVLSEEHVQDIFQVAPLPGGNFMIIGASNGLGNEARIWKLNAHGHTVWIKEYDQFYRFNAMTPSLDGNLIVSGISKIDQNTSLIKMNYEGAELASNNFYQTTFNEFDTLNGEIYAAGAMKNMAAIFRIDSSADTSDQILTPLSTWDSVFNTFILTSDGGFLASHPLYGDYFSAIKLNDSGDTVWQFSDTSKSHILEFREFPTGEYFALSHNFKGAFLHKISSSGNLTLLKKFGYKKTFNAFTIDGNNIIAAGAIGSYPYVEIMSLSGDSLDSYTYSTNIDLNAFSTFTDIEWLNTGQYIAVGEAVNASSSQNNVLAVKFGEFTGTPPSTAYNEANVHVFPNPAEENFNVVLSFPGNKQINIFDMLGNEIVTARIEKDKIQIDTSAWPGGIYFIEVISGSDKIIKRVVKR